MALPPPFAEDAAAAGRLSNILAELEESLLRLREYPTWLAINLSDVDAIYALSNMFPTWTITVKAHTNAVKEYAERLGLNVLPSVGPDPAEEPHDQNQNADQEN